LRGLQIVVGHFHFAAQLGDFGFQAFHLIDHFQQLLVGQLAFHFGQAGTGLTIDLVDLVAGGFDIAGGGAGRQGKQQRRAEGKAFHGAVLGPLHTGWPDIIAA
jgi:hypothetical protein